MEILGFMAAVMLLLFLWGVIGAIVGVVRYYVSRPTTTDTSACADCSLLQELWNSMTLPEKIASLANFTVMKLICKSRGCSLNLLA